MYIYMLLYVLIFFNFPTTIAATSWIFWGTSTPTGRDKHGRHGEANTVYACKLYAGNESDRLLPAGAVVVWEMS
jgi:hypothetical protein